jgi:ATP-dependent DNA helicase RecQ
LLKSEGEYPILTLAPKGSEFLQSGKKLELVRPSAGTVVRSIKKKEEPEYDSELFELLRGVRREIAEKDGVPPFVVFGDTSLREMARFFPRTANDFRRISGVGSFKLEKYGDIFLREIGRFVQENGIESPVRPGKTTKRIRREKSF